MKTRLAALVFTAALAGLAGCQPHHGEVRVHDRDYDVRVVFSDHDRAAIRDYYRRHALPPGLAKKGKIPPGHAFKLHRHQPVPPGWDREALPPELERRLSRLPAGYARVIVGAEVAILHTRTHVVVDVIEDLRR